MRFTEMLELPIVTIVAIDIAGECEMLVEGMWVDGRYKNNIRIDRDTHFSDAGSRNRHAHVYGRTDRTDALVAVRQSGKASHGKRGILHKKDAEALRARGFDIPASGIIEWVELPFDADAVLLVEG